MVTDYVSLSPHLCAVYILSSPRRSIYVGATTDLERRVYEHKTQAYKESHTARHRIDRLVWYEPHDDWIPAHAREIEIKGWTREKKIKIFQWQKSRWQDLSYGRFGWSSSRFRWIERCHHFGRAARGDPSGSLRKPSGLL